MVDHQEPDREAAEGDQGAHHITEKRNEAAEHMGDHERTEGNQGLKRVEQDEAAALLQREENNCPDEREEITQGGGNVIRQSGGRFERRQRAHSPWIVEKRTNNILASSLQAYEVSRQSMSRAEMLSNNFWG